IKRLSRRSDLDSKSNPDRSHSVVTRVKILRAEAPRNSAARLKATGVHHVLIDMRETLPGVRLTKPELFEPGVGFGTQPVLARGRIALLVGFDKEADADRAQLVGCQRPQESASANGTHRTSLPQLDIALNLISLLRSGMLPGHVVRWHGSTRGRRQALPRRLRHELRTLATSIRPTPERPTCRQKG